jgi:hypothetical protein
VCTSAHAAAHAQPCGEPGRGAGFIQNKRAVGRPRDLADVLTLEAELKRRDSLQDEVTGREPRRPR